jgi:predicted DNA-binding helix-hairpin-helix protein
LLLDVYYFSTLESSFSGKLVQLDLSHPPVDAAGRNVVFHRFPRVFAFSERLIYNQTAMDAIEKLSHLTRDADLDVDGEPGGGTNGNHADSLPVSYVSAGGKRVPVLKTLLTSACERDCAYCPFRAGRDSRRVTFKPEEFAAIAENMCRRGLANGLLLSSGIAGGSISTQDRLLDTAKLLREKHRFRGYLHLKLMPGAERDQILEAMTLADRVSVNLEAPGEPYLSKLAPHKRFWEELFQTLQAAEEIRRTEDPRSYGRERWPSLVTQFVVGAAGEKDRDLISWSERILKDLRLARVYYSPFRPIPGTPLSYHPAESPERAHRLYSAFFLLRDYGFSAEELPWTEEGSLMPGDPKENWAKAHLVESPVEINTASLEELIRIPGIGKKRAQMLIKARRLSRIKDAYQLRRMGLPVEKMSPYILLDGRRPVQQLRLF